MRARLAASSLGLCAVALPALWSGRAQQAPEVPIRSVVPKAAASGQAAQVGNRVVQALIQGWARYRDVIPGS
jgi:hypothetical protein